MADLHASNNLSYGTLGRATYNHESQEWVFLRQIGRPPLRDQDGEPEDAGQRFPFPFSGDGQRMVVPASIQYNPTERLSSSKPSKSLQRTLPELLSVPAEIHIGKRLVRTTTPAPPGNRELLTFSNAMQVFEGHTAQRSQFTPIVAYAYGKAGEVLKIAPLTDRGSGPQTEDESLESGNSPFISARDAASWVGCGAPILQIRSAKPKSSNDMWIAVLLATATMFFAPFIRQSSDKDRPTSFGDGHGSAGFCALDANPVVSLPISRTGGYPHADIDFNPENETQVAIVDVRGAWSIWHLAALFSKPVSTSQRIELMAFGKLSAHESSDDNFHAGSWHSICWVALGKGLNGRILVCNRRKMALFNIQGHLLSMINLDLGPLREKQLILDVRSLCGSTGQCLVLTTTKLIWLSSTLPSWLGPKTQPKGLDVILSWRHFLHAEDHSLYLSTLHTGSEMTVLVSSIMNPLTVMFEFAGLDRQPSPLSISDPLPLLLRPVSRRIQGRGRERDLPARIYFQAVQDNVSNGTKRAKAFGSLEAFIQYADLSIWQQTYVQEERLMVVQSLDTGQQNSNSNEQRHVEKDTVGLANLNEFIVEHDNDSAYIASHSKLLPSVTLKQRSTREIPQRWFVDHEDIYQIITGVRKIANAPPSLTLTAYLNDIRPRLFSYNQIPASGARLLMELANKSAMINDIEVESQELDLFQSEMGKRSARSLSLGPTSIYHSQTFSSISEVYDASIPMFLTNLPASTPNQARVSKERNCRNVAADLALSNLAVYIKSKSTQTDDVSQTDHSQFIDGRPTPEPLTSALSSNPSSQQNPPAQGPSGAASQASRRLQALTPLKGPTLTATSNAVSEMTFHLPKSPCESPKDYSYRRAKDKIAASMTAEQVAKMDPKARRKAERARERLDKARQKAASQIAESSQRTAPIVASSQIPKLGQSFEEEQTPNQSMIGFGESSQGKIAVLPYMQSRQPADSGPGSMRKQSKPQGASKRRAGF